MPTLRTLLFLFALGLSGAFGFAQAEPSPETLAVFTKDPSAAVHLIDAKTAKTMISRYQVAQTALAARSTEAAQATMTQAPTSHAFSASAFRAVLANAKVKSIRIHYALSDDGTPALVISAETDGGEVVSYLDRSILCPPMCVIEP